MLKVNHNELKVLMKEYYKKKLALFVFGAFGIGKSFVVRDCAKEISNEQKREFIIWNKISKEEKAEVFKYPEKYFVLIDERLSEYDSCLVGDMKILLYNGEEKAIKDLKEGDVLRGYDFNKDTQYTKPSYIKKVWDKGISKNGIVILEFDDGTKIRTTENHHFLTKEGYFKVGDLKEGNEIYKYLNNENLSISYGTDTKGEKIHNIREGFYKRELQKDESKGNSEEVGEKQKWNKHLCERFRNSENSRRDMGGKKIDYEKLDGSRKGIFGRDNRRRGNDNSCDTKTEDRGIIQTKNNNKQYGQEIIGMDKEQIESKDRNIPTENGKQKDTIHNRNEWVQNTSNIRGAYTLFSHQEREGKDINRLDNEEKKQNVEKSLYRKGQETTLTDKKDKFELRKIRRITYANENEHIFDITTTTGNYIVEKYVCHNSDIKGLPDFQSDKESIEWKIPYWAKFLTLKNSNGILFFDECNLATPIVISSVYKIIYDRCVDDSKIGDNWLIMGAGNRDEDRAFTHTLPAPVRDRGGEVELITSSIEGWTDWASKNDIDTRIIGFLNFKPSSLWKVDFNDNQKYTTNRGWERLSKLIFEVKDWDTLDLLCSSAIGEGIAKEFLAFCKIQEKLKLEDLIKNPHKIKDIQDVSIKYFLISAITEKYKDNKIDFDKVMEVSKVLDENSNAEFVALMWRLCSNYTSKTQKFRDDFMKSKEDVFINKYAKYLI